MSIITGLEAQPRFPYEDLTDNNADMLELMLANIELVEHGHTAAEDVSWVFRVGHPALMDGIDRVYDAPKVDAVNHGITTFEALSAMVTSETPLTHDFFVANARAAELSAKFKERDLRDYIDRSIEAFQTETPKTTEIVARSSRRFYGSLTHYAVLGAALSRQFELESAA